MTDEDKARKELLWGLYQENRNQVRHTETVRQTATTVIFTISTALVAVIGFGSQIKDKRLGLVLMGLGALGIIFNASYTARYRRNRDKADAYLVQLDELMRSVNPLSSYTDLAVIGDSVDEQLDKKLYMRLAKIGNRGFIWIMLPAFIGIIGFIIYRVL